MIYKDYYKILELDTSRVTLEEIKIAYRQVAKKYHPDVNIGDKLAEERIKDINEAYRILSVPSQKRKYDRIWNSKFGKKQEKSKESIIDMFFGNISSKNLENHKKNEKAQIKGENIETEINITLEEAYYGQEKKISLRTIEGKMKTFEVKIPRGILNGEKIRLIGQGKQGKNGGKNGDLFIKINIEENAKFKLEGYDLYTDLLLTPWEAALGTRVEVKTIDDLTKVYIPQGIQSGEKIKIPNKGYIKEGQMRGDLIAQVKIMVPKNLQKEEKEEFEKLKEISKFNPRAQ